MALYVVSVSGGAFLKHCTGDLDLRLPNGCKKQRVIVQCVRCHFENRIRKALGRSGYFWPSHVWETKRQLTADGASLSPLCHALSLQRESFKSQCDGEKLLFGGGIRFLEIVSWLNVLINKQTSERSIKILNKHRRQLFGHAPSRDFCPKNAISLVFYYSTLSAKLFLVYSFWKVTSVFSTHDASC